MIKGFITKYNNCLYTIYPPRGLTHKSGHSMFQRFLDLTCKYWTSKTFIWCYGKIEINRSISYNHQHFFKKAQRNLTKKINAISIQIDMLTKYLFCCSSKISFYWPLPLQCHLSNCNLASFFCFVFSLDILIFRKKKKGMINNNRIYWWWGLTSAETFNGWSTNHAIILFTSLKTIINEPNLKIKKDIC